MTPDPDSHPQPTPTSAYEAQAAFCKTMGHPVRLRILDMLARAGGELPSAEILDRLGIAKPSLSQHLARMQDVRLVVTRREGRYLHVRLTCPEIGQACRQVRELLERTTGQPAAQTADGRPRAAGPRAHPHDARHEGARRAGGHSG